MVVDMKQMCEEQNHRKRKDAAFVRREILTLQESLAQQKRKAKSLYETFALGGMEKAEYLKAKASIQREQENLENRIAEQGNALENLSTENDLRDAIAPQIQKYVDAEDISWEMLNELLIEVLVFPDGRLEIQWKYQDEVSQIAQSLA